MALAQSVSVRYPRVAGPIHTILVLAVLGVWAFLGRIIADQMRAAANPHRVRYYLLTLFFEWLLFVFVWWGCGAVARPSSSFWAIGGIPFARYYGMSESLRRSGWSRRASS